ncbi:MAG: hypothetical protein HW415_1305 [Deltaproteobacteria bacterium]|nr:hypothetical protein [Deltaproteobacteria bacterium]
MQSLSCAHCGNRIFKEVFVFLNEYKKAIAGTRTQSNMEKASLGEVRETSRPPTGCKKGMSCKAIPSRPRGFGLNRKLF